MTEPERLADYLRPELTEARIQAQWSGIVERSARAPRAHFAWYGRAGFAVAILLVCVVGAIGVRRVGHKERAPEIEQLLVERNAAGHEVLTFPEGLSVVLQREARYRVRERTSRIVHLVLERGAAEFDVMPGRNRRVVVTAAAFDVQVIGTHFDVALKGVGDNQDVEVHVQHGRVEVRPNGAGVDTPPIRTLSAGQSWSTRTDAAPGADLQRPESTSVGSAAPLPAASSATPRAEPTATPTDPAPTSAKELFEAAEAFRLKGRAGEAATALDRLRRTHPKDPRAGLAAFELGRIRMDQLGDPAGALNAFSDALRLDPSARFREDAQARVVRLYGSLGQSERCRKARTEFLSRYPSGSHAKTLGTVCEH